MVLWKNDLKVMVRFVNMGHVNIVVHIQHQGFTQVIGFYGNLKKSEGKQSQSLLERLTIIGSMPWLVVSDFNEISSQDDQFRGNRIEAQMDSFKETGFSGVLAFKDTSFQQRRSCNTQERLDKAYVNALWLEKFT